ncbi:hypothetical protein [Dietzia sp.]|uniref:hypothetical protein n=1 Tax=Dietzia sp. TaxID=1871616 RepID=UPI002FD980BE
MTTRIRAALASTAAVSLLAGGAAIALGAPAASAADSTANCKTSQTKTYKWAGSFGTDYTLTKEVVGDATVAPGGTVTYRTTVEGAGALISKITDFHPAGFQLTSARESVWKLIGGQSWSTVTDNVTKDGNANSVSRSGAGWTTALGAHVSFETTYKVPADAVPGTVLNSGSSFAAVLTDGTKTENPFDVCVTIREPNAIEQATGSVDDAGLGSLTSGSTSSATISSDPSGFFSDIINGVDIAKLAGS